MSFLKILDKNHWVEISNRIEAQSTLDVQNTLAKVEHGERAGLDDFLTLISPSAEKYLEPMAKLSFQITRKKFGNNINLFAPIYLSNECNNICTYCGFSQNNPVERKTLKESEILQEIDFLKKQKFDNILLLTGENSKRVGLSYFEKVIPLFKKNFNFVAIEVQPLEGKEYRKLIELGLNAIYVYQETYHRDTYKLFHPRGKKSNFEYRLATPERVGNQRIRKMGLGILLGLTDWRVDSFFCALHLNYLKKKYWRTQFSVSFPRLKPASQVEKVKESFSVITEKNLFQLILAYRIFDEDLDLSLSTRESETFRDKVIRFGITTMSAGSKTNPGGYSCHKNSLEQFEISDERSPQEISQVLEGQNLETVWKDWDLVFK